MTPTDHSSRRVAIVTGAAGAIGGQIADALEGAGHEVLRVDLRGRGVFAADVSTPEGNEAAVRQALSRFSRLDTIVLAAGAQHVAPIGEFPAEWNRLMGAMATGPFLTIRAAWEQLTARPGGRIVAVGSTSGQLGEPGKVAYTAAKHALAGVIKVAAIEGGPLGLTANLLAPTWTGSPMVDAQVAERARTSGLEEVQVIEQMVGRQPLPRLVAPAEVAAAALFLLDEMAGAITGISLPIDCGLGITA